MKGEKNVGRFFTSMERRTKIGNTQSSGPWLFALLLIFIIGTDQYIKFLAKRFLDASETISLFGDLIRLTLIKNHDGFLGIASSLSDPMRFFLLNICVFGLLLVCLVYLFRYKNRYARHFIPLVFVTGGGISNLLDRLFNSGGVTDFLSIGMGSLRTGIFNLADVYIICGSFVLGFVLFSSPEDSSHTRDDK